MRRSVGSGLPRRVDMAITPSNVIDLFADVADAIVNYEPRFRPSRMSIETPTNGALEVSVSGTYYPRGHLGDFSVSEPQRAGLAL